MAEFTNTKAVRIAKLKEVSKLLLETGNANSFITTNKEFISTVIPSDFITLFDEVIKDGFPMGDVKILTNKLLNIFHIPIREYERVVPKSDSFLGVLEQNNLIMTELLDKIRPVF
ncbi:hypothetical protein [Alkalitalea saponilacus]|nr:hypothetical protein [Alkalitalea saponilacus]ASB47735.1 hypothetical protein CDL62_00490 [Alkalitalea saponilacus]